MTRYSDNPESGSESNIRKTSFSGFELDIKNIFQSVLGCNRKLDAKADFFASGGDSIEALDVLDLLRDKYGCSIEIPDFLEASDAKSLAVKVNEALKAVIGASEKATLPSANNKSFPLSMSQQYLWLYHQTSVMDATYNIAFSVKLKGYIDELLLDSAFQIVIKRHEQLRIDLSTQGIQRTTLCPYPQLETPALEIYTPSFFDSTLHPILFILANIINTLQHKSQ